MAKRKRTHHRKPRRLLAIPIIIVFAVIFFRFEQDSIVTETYDVNSSLIPESFENFRIVQLSDLHGKQFGTDNQSLLEAVKALDPDLIVITGDLIDDISQMEDIPALASGLSAIAQTCYVTGNHEWAVGNVSELKQILSDNGVTVLSNEYIVLNRGDDQIILAGADDPNGYADQKTPEELYDEIVSEQGPDNYVILLYHRDYVDTYTDWDYNLILSGHGHGGIFRIPIIDQGLFSSDHKTLFPKYDGGMYVFSDDLTCIVSRGLGSNTVPIHAFRLFNRPDLPLIVLHSS